MFDHHERSIYFIAQIFSATLFQRLPTPSAPAFVGLQEERLMLEVKDAEAIEEQNDSWDVDVAKFKWSTVYKQSMIWSTNYIGIDPR